MKTNFIIKFIDSSEINYNLENKTFCFTGKLAHIFLNMQIALKLTNRDLLRQVFRLNKIKGGISNTILEKR